MCCIQTLSCAAHNCDILVDDENVMYVGVELLLYVTVIDFFIKCLLFIDSYFLAS